MALFIVVGVVVFVFVVVAAVVVGDVTFVVVVDRRNLPLKFGQTWVSYRWNIAVVVVVVVVVVAVVIDIFIPETYL